MALIVTSSRRRIVMAVLLALAAGGTLVRYTAPDPSTLRDMGTLFMVMWLPAVGNLISFLATKVPRSAPPPTDFPAGSVFVPQLTVVMEPVALSAEAAAVVGPALTMCTLIVGRRGFTARPASNVVDMIAGPGERTVLLELLRPASAEPHLSPGTEFHVLVGTIAVARGRVASSVAPP